MPASRQVFSLNSTPNARAGTIAASCRSRLVGDEIQMGTKPMITRLLASVLFAAALAQGAAFAQNNNMSGNTAASNVSAQQLPEEIKNKLQQDGFTDVKVIPGSFLVSAKDKNGDTVNMVIGPNSMMMLTEVPANTTTGAGSPNQNTSK
ncbi:MAG TPA: hypothetical protein VFA57_00840 [Pseudolabrys sp.]|nr:hypothetical protein [Pseudolabrys sp.]